MGCLRSAIVGLTCFVASASGCSSGPSTARGSGGGPGTSSGQGAGPTGTTGTQASGSGGASASASGTSASTSGVAQTGAGSVASSASTTSAGAGASSSSGSTSSTSGGPPTFCLLGTLGCTCDASGSCASGLSCTDHVCCDTATGDCGVPPASSGSTGAGGAAGAADAGGCVQSPGGVVLTDCGYPHASSNSLTSVVFNESTVLRVIQPTGGYPFARIRLFYNDEHALTLGVRSVVVKNATGTATTAYAVAPLATSPGTAMYPATGANAVVGDQSGLDPVGRPMWPALYVTDITDDPNSTAGDWQQGGTPWNPTAVFGTWKAAVRTVDTTVTPNTVTVTPDADPAKNGWSLGGGDPVPAGLSNEGYGAEVRWDVVLQPGRSYRIQVMVHDGDQNKTGGDSGEACVNYCAASAD